MKVVGYTYDAAMHCPNCTFTYARGVEYEDYDWEQGKYSDEDITLTYNPGVLDVSKAIELEIIKDSEGNPIHPIFDTEESDTPEHCDDCHEFIDTSWTGAAIDYAVESLQEYVKGRMAGAEHPGAEAVLDEWDAQLEYYWEFEQRQELIRELYQHVRQYEKENG